jgi:transcription termination factor Rho
MPLLFGGVVCNRTGKSVAMMKREFSVPPDQLKKMYVLRRILNPMGTMDAIDFLLDKLRNTKNNGEFFDSMNT